MKIVHKYFCAVKIFLENFETLHLICVYIPYACKRRIQKQLFDDTLRKLSNHSKTSTGPFMICGDFNEDFLKPSHQRKADATESFLAETNSHLVDLMSHLSMLRCTRSDARSESWIDHVVASTTFVKKIISVATIELPHNPSDHWPILTALKPMKRTSTHTPGQIAKVDWFRESTTKLYSKCFGSELDLIEIPKLHLCDFCFGKCGHAL